MIANEKMVAENLPFMLLLEVARVQTQGRRDSADLLFCSPFLDLILFRDLNARFRTTIYHRQPLLFGPHT